MPKKKKPLRTRFYELVVTFAGREQRLFHHVNEDDRQRLFRVLTDCREEHGLYELGGAEGLECLVNTPHVRRVNVLDYLGGIEFEAEPELTEKQSQQQFEAREASDVRVTIRIWIRGEREPIVHHGIEHAAWGLARTCLMEKEKFIYFRDEDEEDVIYGTDHIDAIEMIDSFYLQDEQVEKILSRYDGDEDDMPANVSESTDHTINPKPSAS